MPEHEVCTLKHEKQSLGETVHPTFAGAGEGSSLHCESNFCGLQTNVYETENSSLEKLFIFEMAGGTMVHVPLSCCLAECCCCLSSPQCIFRSMGETGRRRAGGKMLCLVPTALVPLMSTRWDKHSPVTSEAVKPGASLTPHSLPQYLKKPRPLSFVSEWLLRTHTAGMACLALKAGVCSVWETLTAVPGWEDISEGWTWARRYNLKEKNGRLLFWSKSFLFVLPKQVLEWALVSKLQIKLATKKTVLSHLPTSSDADLRFSTS